VRRRPSTDEFTRALWAADAALRRGWCAEAAHQLRTARSVFPSFTASQVKWKGTRDRYDRLEVRVKRCMRMRGR
jgi:hypothetical protein